MKKKKLNTKSSLIYIFLSVLTLFLLYFGKEIIFLLPWKTYTNEEYGFSVKYPRNFYLIKKSSNYYKLSDYPFPGEQDRTSLNENITFNIKKSHNVFELNGVNYNNFKFPKSLIYENVFKEIKNKFVLKVIK